MSKCPSQCNQESIRKRSKPVFRNARLTHKDFKGYSAIQEPPPITSSRVFTLRTNGNGRRSRYSVDARQHQQNQVGVEPSPSNASVTPEDPPNAFVAPEDPPLVDSLTTGFGNDGTEPSPKKKRIYSNTTSVSFESHMYAGY